MMNAVTKTMLDKPIIRVEMCSDLLKILCLKYIKAKKPAAANMPVILMITSVIKMNVKSRCI